MSKWGARIALICLHVVQYLVAWSAGLLISSLIAAVLIGAQVLPRDHFVKTFRVRPVLVSQLGSLVWLFVAFLEMGAGQ